MEVVLGDGENDWLHWFESNFVEIIFVKPHQKHYITLINAYQEVTCATLL